MQHQSTSSWQQTIDRAISHVLEEDDAPVLHHTHKKRKGKKRKDDALSNKYNQKLYDAPPARPSINVYNFICVRFVTATILSLSLCSVLIYSCTGGGWWWVIPCCRPVINWCRCKYERMCGRRWASCAVSSRTCSRLFSSFSFFLFFIFFITQGTDWRTTPTVRLDDGGGGLVAWWGGMTESIDRRLLTLKAAAAVAVAACVDGYDDGHWIKGRKKGRKAGLFLIALDSRTRWTTTTTWPRLGSNQRPSRPHPHSHAAASMMITTRLLLLLLFFFLFYFSSLCRAFDSWRRETLCRRRGPLEWSLV